MWFRAFKELDKKAKKKDWWRELEKAIKKKKNLEGRLLTHKEIGQLYLKIKKLKTKEEQ